MSSIRPALVLLFLFTLLTGAMYPLMVNLGPLNPALAETVEQRIAALRAADPGNSAPVPVDLVYGFGQRPRPTHLAGSGLLPG